MNPKALITLLIILSACQSQPNQPLTGTEWGEIPNSSFEDVMSSDVLSWIPERGNHAGIHFYDHIAQDGVKSLTIHSESPKSGRWYTKVNVKPWSVYSFSGWIKTKSLIVKNGGGAGFHMGAYGREFKLLSENQFFSGDHDWTEVVYEFETDDQDCIVLECLFNQGGQASGQVWFDNLSLKEISHENISPDIRINLAQEKAIMQDYIYGQFIEHLGKCIYGGIWAEMIEDRKFFFMPADRQSPWTLEGSKENLGTDIQNSYVGEHTPILTNKPDSQVILKQDGLGLKKDMSYSGRIVLKSSGIKAVDIILSWGDSNEEKATYSINNPDPGYSTYPIAFQSPIDCTNASIQIVPKGIGSVSIGTISLMPDDNIEGFRADVLELLKELNSPVYRWPGGNFVSGYDWKDGIGDRDKRPPRKNPAWTGIEPNDVGIHEFMRFCELLNTEPYIAVNAGLGGAEEARNEVEYCNGDEDTPMGRLRKENGHSKPWMVKWWSIGNEMYGGWQLGHMSTEQFVKKHNDFADAMRSVDPSIKLVAVGDVGPWDEMILANCADNMDLISEHFYRQDWHGGGLMTHINQIPDAIREKAQAHRKYREEIPALKGKDIQICLDEWNYWYGPHIYGELGTRYYLRDALGAAAGINEFSRQSDIIFMANYAQTVNVIGAIKATKTESVMAATGQALKMYRQYFGSIPVEVSGEMRPFNIAATVTKDHKYLTISLVNPTWESHSLPVTFEGSTGFREVEVIKLQGASDMAYNVPGQEEKVIISEPEIIGFNGKLTIMPFEARIYRFTMN